MAGVVTQEQDLLNSRVVSMWAEAGIQFRSNLLLHEGAQIVLHAHSYDHVADVRHGVFDAQITSPEGGVDLKEVTAPCRIFVPAGWIHGFTLKSFDGQPGEICCMWAAE